VSRADILMREQASLTLTSVVLWLHDCHDSSMAWKRRSGASNRPFWRRSMCAGAALSSQYITYLQQQAAAADMSVSSHALEETAS
jgi:hypothetical protein